MIPLTSLWPPITILAIYVYPGKARPLAVLQLINKTSGKYFLKEEQEALEMLCQELSPVLQKKAWELLNVFASKSESEAERAETEVAFSVLQEVNKH